MSRVVLITGGSGALGAAIVHRFLASGDRVAFTYHRHAQAAESLARATGALALEADLTQASQVESTLGRVEGELGTVEVLINNAGVTQVMPFPLIEEEDWDLVINGNLRTLFLVTKAVLRKMIAARAGCIVNIGSLAGERVLEVPVHYATAKAAVGGFTRALAREVARYGIRVNAVVPGMLSAGIGSLVPDRQRKDYLQHCLAGRPGEVNEAAEVVHFLASKEASYVNAQAWMVDGGI